MPTHPQIQAAAAVFLEAIQRYSTCEQTAMRKADGVVRIARLPVDIIRAEIFDHALITWAVKPEDYLVYAAVPQCLPSLWLGWKRTRLSCLQMARSRGYVLGDIRGK